MAAPTHYRLFIDGELRDNADHYNIPYPYNGQVTATAARAGEAEMEAAIDAAVRAFSETRRLTRARRAEILASMSRGVAERRREFEQSITLSTGKPISYSRAEVSRTIMLLA